MLVSGCILPANVALAIPFSSRVFVNLVFILGSIGGEFIDRDLIIELVSVPICIITQVLETFYVNMTIWG